MTTQAGPAPDHKQHAGMKKMANTEQTRSKHGDRNGAEKKMAPGSAPMATTAVRGTGGGGDGGGASNAAAWVGRGGGGAQQMRLGL